MNLYDQLTNSPPHGVVKIGFWNIEGYKSQIIGNKLIHQDLLDKVLNRDIIGLSETHIHQATLGNLAIPGFVRIHYHIRKANLRGKGSGGLALFCKPHLSIDDVI